MPNSPFSTDVKLKIVTEFTVLMKLIASIPLVIDSIRICGVTLRLPGGTNIARANISAHVTGLLDLNPQKGAETYF